MTYENMGPLVVFVGACLALCLLALWAVWTVQWTFERLCDVIEAVTGKEDPSGPYH